MEEVLAKRPVSAKGMNKARRQRAAFDFGFTLKEIRRRRGVSQIRLASILNVSQNRISKLERGQVDKVQLDTLMRYVEALGGRLTVTVTLGNESAILAQSTPLTESPVTWSDLVNR